MVSQNLVETLRSPPPPIFFQILLCVILFNSYIYDFTGWFILVIWTNVAMTSSYGNKMETIDATGDRKIKWDK